MNFFRLMIMNNTFKYDLKYLQVQRRCVQSPSSQPVSPLPLADRTPEHSVAGVQAKLRARSEAQNAEASV